MRTRHIVSLVVCITLAIAVWTTKGDTLAKCTTSVFFGLAALAFTSIVTSKKQTS